MRHWLRRARYAIRHRQLETELAEEIEFHRAMKQRELEARGLAPMEARAAAGRALGNELLARDRARDVWIWPWLLDAAHDVRFAMRLAVKELGFTTIAVITLALGIAANSTVFTIVNAMTIRGLPVDEPDRIVTFSDDGGVLAVSYRDVEDWREAMRSFAGIAGYSTTTATLGDEGRAPEAFGCAFMSFRALGLLRKRPLLGRAFTRADDEPGARPVVILGHRVWSSRYGGDPGVIGRTIRVNTVPTTVVGVMPPGFRFPVIQELWLPLSALPGLDRERREARVLRAFARLADGVSMRQAQAELRAVASRVAKDHRATGNELRPRVTPYTGSPDHPIFLSLFGAVAFVLLIACANVANLLLARSVRRSREIAVRVSLGATRGRIVRQLLAESLLLALAGGLLGLALSVVCMRVFAHSIEGITFAYWYHERWTMDARVFTFVASVCLATVFAFGVVPALHLSRTNVSEGIKEGGHRGTTGPAARRWTSALLAAELAFTVILLATAGLMMRSFVAIYDADAIVDTTNLWMMSLRAPSEKYGTAAQRVRLFDQVEERLGGLDPVGSVTVTSVVPFIGAPRWTLETARGQQSAASERSGAHEGGLVSYVSIGPRYFETLGVGLLRGRAFSAIDGTPGHESAIVNARLASMYFGNEDPVGRRIRITNPAASGGIKQLSATIVGVAPTVRQQFFTDIDPVVYVPNRANPSAASMVMVRGRAGEAVLVPALQATVRDIDPDVVLFRVAPLDTAMRQSRWGHRVFGTMFTIFAAIALVVAAAGLYAVTAYGVTQREQEIGVRMALGARASQVIWLFVRRALPPLTVGLVVGLAGAAGVGRLIQGFLVQTDAVDPSTLITIALLLVTVSVVACLWPARRASHLDPVRALRAE